jgi:hypothetical protein
MPEWYLLIGLLAALSAVGAVWPPLLATLPLLLLSAAAPLVQAAVAARRALDAQPRIRGFSRARLLALTASLHLLQPAARLYGRVCRGLTPLRSRGIGGAVVPLPRVVTTWTETWVPPERRLTDLAASLRDRGAVVPCGGDFDRWDSEVRGGVFGAARVRLVVEEHGRGRQLARYRVWPRLSPRATTPLAFFAAIALIAAADGARGAGLIFGAAAALGFARAAYECGAAMATVLDALVPAESSAKCEADSQDADSNPAALAHADDLELAGGDVGPQ